MAIDTFGVPNVDTQSSDYNPEEQFRARTVRLRELVDKDALIAGNHGEHLYSLASFAASALRAGIDMARRDGQPIESILTTTAVDIISDAIDAAITNPDIRHGIVVAEQMRQKMENIDG